MVVVSGNHVWFIAEQQITEPTKNWHIPSTAILFNQNIMQSTCNLKFFSSHIEKCKKKEVNLILLIYFNSIWQIYHSIILSIKIIMKYFMILYCLKNLVHTQYL